MSRAELSSNLPVEITERIKNIDNIYKIVNTKLLPLSPILKGVRSERFIREPPRGFEPHSHHPAGGRQKGGSRERLPHCTECGSRSHKRACRSGVGVETKGWTRFRAPTRSRGAGRGSEPRRGQEGLGVVPAV